MACSMLLQDSFASDEDNYGDCQNSTVLWYLWYTSIYPTELIGIAQNNLKQYCCKYKKLYLTTEQSEQCKKKIADYYVDSPRLYDHLIDVGMRYLDGDETLQYKDSNSKVILDTKWKERRDSITKYWDKPTWWIPLELQSKYTQYRWTMIEDFDIIDSSKDCEDRIIKFDEYNKTRDTLSLGKKYFLLCELNSCMVNGQKNNRISACQSMVTERITAERNYVQWLLLHQSTLALATNFEAYALWYINHDKFTKLLEKIVMMSKWLGFVNSKVNEMTKMCSA